MKYCDALKQEREQHICPFCSLPPQHIIQESDFFYVTLARAPYVPHHILIVPKTHKIRMKDLSHDELDNLFDLIEKWTILLHAQHKNVDLFLKDCVVGETGKTIEHLHFHLIPDCQLVTANGGEEREFLDDQSYGNYIIEIKETFMPSK
ncbi:MAG: HIT family protein [bacterium]